MHSEAELLAMWKEAQGEACTRRPARRQQRLIEQQLEALRWLESLAVVAPVPHDKVAAWLEPQVARRLANAGIDTLTDLGRWIDLHGYHWHRHVPRIGARGAQRVTGWWARHADTLGPVPAHALKPLSQLDTQTLTPVPAIGVVPLERLRLPANLSGSNGVNRAEAHRCKTSAVDDLAAVHAWL
ncbi:MAG: phage integrase family protein, partial [Pseudomonadota bacterium]|nr:phage integrase family protein [Pseudomonadota bacterium]